MSSLRVGHLIHDASAVFLGEYIPVVYNHHLERDELNPGHFVRHMKYKAWQLKSEREETAWEWGMDFCGAAKKVNKVIVARPDWHHAHIHKIEDMDCYGENIRLVLADQADEMITLTRDVRYRSRWTPHAYASHDANGDIAALRRVNAR